MSAHHEDAVRHLCEAEHALFLFDSWLLRLSSLLNFFVIFARLCVVKEYGLQGHSILLFLLLLTSVSLVILVRVNLRRLLLYFIYFLAKRVFFKEGQVPFLIFLCLQKQFGLLSILNFFSIFSFTIIKADETGDALPDIVALRLQLLVAIILIYILTVLET